MCSSVTFFFRRLKPRSQPRSHPSTVQNPNNLCFQEFTTRSSADRDPHGIFHTPTDASALRAAGLVGSLGSSSLLPTVERALAELGGSGSGATLGSLRRRTGAVTSPILGSEKPDAGPTTWAESRQGMRRRRDNVEEGT